MPLGLPANVPVPSEAPPLEMTVILSSLESGAAISRVQGRLVEVGWRIGVDGIFGNDTDRAVRGFQQRKALAIDGVVGAKTWRTLFP